MSENTSQTTLRDTIEANFNAAQEAEKVQAPEPVQEAVVQDAPESTRASDDKTTSDKVRDEKGRFAAKQAEAKQAEQQAQEVSQEVKAPEAPAEPPIPRPTTWKKEYMPAWEKMAKGEPLTAEESKKLAQYNVQREREFATGVSTYRAEAQNARHLNDALAPFMQTIQRQGMTPASFVQELGRSYHFLVNGGPQEKMQALANLARNVGIPIEAIAQQQGNQLDPVVPQLLQEIQNIKNQVGDVASWREQQENQIVQNEISRFYDQEKYPHFKNVRHAMGVLIQQGIATDLDSAYQKAVWMNDDARQAELARQAQYSAPQTQAPAVNRVAEAAQARAKVISPRSVAPSGTPKTVDPKNLKSMLESAFDAHMGTGKI